MRERSSEEEAYHVGTAAMSTDAALNDAFTPAPPNDARTVTEPALKCCCSSATTTSADCPPAAS